MGLTKTPAGAVIALSMLGAGARALREIAFPLVDYRVRSTD
ncbi:MAG: hypothetical protein OER93_01090 [Thermoleophilia bacterium]|nr:hypothetical protein [Thermoleophilia bacterium]